MVEAQIVQLSARAQRSVSTRRPLNETMLLHTLHPSFHAGFDASLKIRLEA